MSTLTENLVKNKIDMESKYSLILLDDDHNTFEHVMKSLVECCDHTAQQAEQCTYIAHVKGKCEVKRADIDHLLYIKSQLSECGLSSEIQ